MRGGFGILGRGHILDHGLDAVGIEHAVFASCHKVVDGDGGRDTMTGHDIQSDDVNVFERIVTAVAVKYLLDNGSAHEASPHTGNVVPRPWCQSVSVFRTDRKADWGIMT